MVWDRYRWAWKWKSGPFATWEPKHPDIDFSGAVFDGIRKYLVNLVGQGGITGVSVRDVTTKVTWESTVHDYEIWYWTVKGTTVTTFDVEHPEVIDPVTLLAWIVVLVLWLVAAYVLLKLQKPIESVANAVEYVGKAIYEVAKAAPSAVGLGFLILAVALLFLVAPVPKPKPKPKEGK